MLALFWIFSFGVQAGETLTIAVSKSPLSLPIYVAESQGYFSSEGAQVKLDEVIGGHRSLKKLLDGEADLATASEAVVMFNSFRRNDFAVIATFVSSRDDVKIVVRKEANITKPKHLVGKRIATVVGSASHYYLDTWLLFHDIDPKSVKVVNIHPEGMQAALSKGEVDAVAIWEPYSYNLSKALVGSTVLPNVGIYDLTFNLIVHKKLMGMRDEELVKVLRALARAQQFIKDEPLKAQAILRTRLQLEQAYIDWIWSRNHYELSLDQTLISTLESEARWARQEGHVTENKVINYLDFIFIDPLMKALPMAVGIKK
ncbi:MAG: ABC transporter substrate-binding protein [Gallionellaceae bacterium]|nr:ABC transporter substrate-binding protein [Gallionellaceae bacterium]